MQIPSVTEIAPHLGSHRYEFWERVCVRSSVSSCCKRFHSVLSALFFTTVSFRGFYFYYFFSLFLALLKLTTLRLRSLAPFCGTCLPRARCPGFSPEVVFWLLGLFCIAVLSTKLQIKNKKKRHTTKRTSTWVQKKKGK